ncbi:MAG: diacylglycerol kinase family protein [Chitinophagaceae bacterium]
MPKTGTGFSWRSRATSFGYAWEGIRQFLKTEHNARIHLGITIAVVALSFFLHISGYEAIALVIVIALVWITELLNTAMEKAMDFIAAEKHPQIKWVKDLAAAAVLVAAFAAVVVGCIVFIPKILYWVYIYFPK